VLDDEVDGLVRSQPLAEERDEDEREERARREERPRVDA